MAIKNVRHPEWRKSHEDTRYPFSQTSTLRNDAGDVIFEGTFLDASFYPVNGQRGFYLSRVIIESDAVTLVLGDDGTEFRASSTFDRATPPDIIRFVDNYNRPAGVIVSESIRLSLFGGWAVGEHVFLPEQTSFVARCCIPTPGVGFRGFELDSGEVITEDIWLVGDRGVVLSCEKVELLGACGEPTQIVDAVRIDIVGDPLFRRRLCTEPGLFETPRFLQTITFCNPSRAGAAGTPGHEGEAIADVLMLTDTTSSMGDYIATTKAIFSLVASEVEAELPNTDLYWAAADYKDFEDGGDYLNFGYHLGSKFNANPAFAKTAIDAWEPLGGEDAPEQQMAALLALANAWTTLLEGREGAQKLIVWAGDAPGWLNGAKSFPYPSFEQVVAALKAKNIKVIAVSSEPVGYGIDMFSQASAIVNECGGAMLYNTTVSSAEILKSLLVENIAREVVPGSPGDPGRTQACHVCGPGDLGNVNITVGSQQAADTILRVRSVKEGMIIEAVGEQLHDIR